MKLGGYKSNLVDRRPMWSIYDLCDKFGLEVKSTSHKLRGNGAPQIVKKVNSNAKRSTGKQAHALTAYYYLDDFKKWVIDNNIGGYNEK